MPVVTVIEGESAQAIYNDPALTRRVRAAVTAWLGPDRVGSLEPRACSSEDFSQYGRTVEKVPICFYIARRVGPREDRGERADRRPPPRRCTRAGSPRCPSPRSRPASTADDRRGARPAPEEPECSRGMASGYTEASIKTLSSTEHIRLRPGMYIGRLGSGAHAEDGIYVLLEETIDNARRRVHDGRGRKIEVEARGPDGAGSRLRPRHPARQAPRVRLDHQHRRQVRQRDLQEGGGPERVGQKAVNALSVDPGPRPCATASRRS